MVGKFLFATTALGVMVGLGTGTACSVKTTSGTGGATGVTATAASSTTTMTTASGCVDNMGTKHCASCVTAFDCGVASTNTTLAGNCNGMGKSSYDLYGTLYDCLCGADGKTGSCGGKCSKTCTGTGMDDASCQGCVGGAATGTCSSAYSACKKDT